jgi:hypothetical protein
MNETSGQNNNDDEEEHQSSGMAESSEKTGLNAEKKKRDAVVDAKLETLLPHYRNDRLVLYLPSTTFLDYVSAMLQWIRLRYDAESMIMGGTGNAHLAQLLKEIQGQALNRLNTFAMSYSNLFMASSSAAQNRRFVIEDVHIAVFDGWMAYFEQQMDTVAVLVDASAADDSLNPLKTATGADAPFYNRVAKIDQVRQGLNVVATPNNAFVIIPMRGPDGSSLRDKYKLLKKEAPRGTQRSPAIFEVEIEPVRGSSAWRMGTIVFPSFLKLIKGVGGEFTADGNAERRVQAIEDMRRWRVASAIRDALLSVHDDATFRPEKQEAEAGRNPRYELYYKYRKLLGNFFVANKSIADQFPANAVESVEILQGAGVARNVHFLNAFRKLGKPGGSEAPDTADDLAKLFRSLYEHMLAICVSASDHVYHPTMEMADMVTENAVQIVSLVGEPQVVYAAIPPLGDDE